MRMRILRMKGGRRCTLLRVRVRMSLTSSNGGLAMMKRKRKRLLRRLLRK